MTDSQVTDSRTDEQLLRLGRDGDEEAFLALYRRYNSPVFRFAFHMSGGDREIAEEAVQEVFVALLADRIGFDKDRGTLEAFLIGIARNQVRRQMQQARRVAPVEMAQSEPDLTANDILESRLVMLRNAILALPESYRAVTVLCDLEELSYSEAAARLGCALGTVRSRLHRARAILETKLRRSEQCLISTTR